MLEGILLSGSSPGVDWHIVRFLNCSYKSDFVEQELPQHSNTSFGGEEGVGSAISGSTEYYTKIHQNSSSRLQGQQISAEGSGHSAVGRGDSAVGRGRSAVGSGSSAVGSDLLLWEVDLLLWEVDLLLWEVGVLPWERGVLSREGDVLPWSCCKLPVDLQQYTACEF